MFNVSYRVYDKNGRRIAKDKIAKAASFEIIFNKQLVQSVAFPKSYKKSDKQYEVEAFIHDVEESLLILKEEEKAEKQRKRIEYKEKKLIQKSEKRIKKIQDEERKLARLIKDDLNDIWREEAKEASKLKRLEKLKELELKKEDEFVFDNEIEERKEQRKKLRQEAGKLTRTVRGRIRLWVKEQLNERFLIWEDTKVEQFVKELETAYGVDIKKIKDRALETNFKKFITKVVKVMDHHDIRERPTAEQLLRAAIKRDDFEKKLEDQDKFINGQEIEDIEYTLIKEVPKLYFSKKSNSMTMTKQFIFEFNTQLDVTSFSVDSDVVNETLDAVSDIIRKEVMRLFSKDILKIGKNFQVRLLIPQYDEAGETRFNYVGGNGSDVGSISNKGEIVNGRTGYGISIQSLPFSLSGLDTILNKDDGLMALTKDRLRGYLEKNIGFIFSQYISGFMIIVGV